MKFPILAVALCVFTCHSAADESKPLELKDRLITVFPGQINLYQFETVMPDPHTIGACFIADKKMDQYPPDLAKQGALELIGQYDFFEQRKNVKDIIAGLMTTKDIKTLGIPAIVLFLHFSRYETKFTPSYAMDPSWITTYCYTSGNHMPMPRLLILNAQKNDTEIKEMSTILASVPHIRELQRRRELDAVQKEQQKILKKQDFGIAVQIHRNEFDAHLEKATKSCTVL